MKKKAFVPISLANPFYTRDLVRYLWKMHLKEYDFILIVPCDTLRYLTYEGKGEVYPGRLVDQQAFDLRNLIEKIANEIATEIDLPSYEIRLFSDIQRQVEYQEVAFKMDVICRSNANVAEDFEEVCRFWVNRIFDGVNERRLEIQRRYVIEETALSIFVTENLGYSDEYYSKKDRMFVNWLYDNMQSVVSQMINKPTLDRQFYEIALFAQ